MCEPADVLTVGGEGEIPAGEAVEEGKIRSSMFIGSGSWVFELVFDKSKDFRSFAIPDGALEFCWCKLWQTISVKGLTSVRKHGYDSIRTGPAPVLCASNSWPSSSTSNSPFAPGLAIVSSSCCKASRFVLPADPASASLRVV